MELYSTLKKSFVRVPGRVVIGGFDVGFCGSVCVWGLVSGFRGLFFVRWM